MKRSVKWCMAGLVLFIMIIGICTYISTQVYKQSLVQVMTAEAVADHLRETYYFDGSVSAVYNENYCLPVACKVIEIYCETGQRVEEGTQLFRVDSDELELEYLELEQQSEALDGQDRMDELTFKIIEEKRAEIKKILRNGCVITARGEGQILAAPSVRRYEAEQSILVYGDTSREMEVTWYLPQNAIMPEAVFYRLAGESYERKLTRDTYHCYYDDSKNSWRCRGVIEKGTSALPLGMSIHMNASVVSEEEYPYVLPDTAIYGSETSGGYYIYCLASRETSMGTEYYVRRRGVEILGRMGGYAAISADPKTEVVIAASGELTDLQTVWVLS